MKLPDLPFLKKKVDTEYILILLLRQEKANAVIVEKKASQISILNQHEEFFSTNLEEAHGDEWLDILDAAITRAEEKLPPAIETHKTVFGIPNSWVEEKQIKKDYLGKLKHASDELDLKPIGFIEIPEAIIHAVSEKEGAPVSSVLAEVGKKYVVLTLTRAGRIIDTKAAPLKGTSVETADALLKQFSVEVLPSRLIIYNGDDSKEMAQNFTKHHWSKSIPFLHPPQIMLLEKGFDVDAVVEGAASQLGAETNLAAHSMVTAAAAGAHETEAEDEAKETEDLPLDAKTASAFGFVVGKDIEELPEEETSEAKEAETDEIKPTDSEPIINDPYEKKGMDDAGFREEHVNLKTPDFPRESQEKTGTKSFLAGISLPPFLKNLGDRLPGNMPKNKFFLLIPGVLILLIILSVVYATVTRAEIELKVRPEVAEEEADVMFVTTGESDFSDNILAAQTLTVMVSGKAETRATGEKEEGEKAKGTVTIFNSSSDKKELAEGTVITSSNNLSFELDKEVIVASASGDIFSGTQSGTAKVPVTAVEIGKESNIPSNTTFKIGNDSSLGAKNDEAFSGGSKKEIRVVSKNDLAKLAADLPKSLMKEAEDQVNQKLGSQEILLTVYSDFSPSASDYSAGEGDEAETVSLESEVEMVGVFYNNKDLVEFTKSLIKEEFSDDLTLDEENITTTVIDFEEEDGDYSAKLSLEANLVPKIDEQNLRERLKGKSFDEANEILESLPQVISTRISLFPPIPFLNILPRRAENIEIKVSAND